MTSISRCCCCCWVNKPPPSIVRSIHIVSHYKTQGIRRHRLWSVYLLHHTSRVKLNRLSIFFPNFQTNRSTRKCCFEFVVPFTFILFTILVFGKMNCGVAICMYYLRFASNNLLHSKRHLKMPSQKRDEREKKNSQREQRTLYVVLYIDSLCRLYA